MCLCNKCAWADHFFGSLRTKVMVFCFWTLLHGIIATGILGYSAFTDLPDMRYSVKKTKTGLYFLLAVIHTYSGILMLLAIVSNIPHAFLLSVVLSTCFPMGFISTYLAYLMIAQVVFIVFSCRYYSTQMGVNQYSEEPTLNPT